MHLPYNKHLEQIVYHLIPEHSPIQGHPLLEPNSCPLLRPCIGQKLHSLPCALVSYHRLISIRMSR